MVFALRGFAGKPSTTFFRQFHCRKHCFRRTRLYCSDCGENVGTERITNLICSRKLGGCESASIFHGTVARRAHGSSALVHAMRDLIASNALLRTRRHKARPFYTKTLPRGSNGDRSPLGLSFSPIFLETKKDGVPKGRWSSIAVSKNGPQIGKHMHPCAPLRPFFMLPSYHVFLPLSSIIFPFCRNFQENLPQNRPRTA